MRNCSISNFILFNKKYLKKKSNSKKISWIHSTYNPSLIKFMCSHGKITNYRSKLCLKKSNYNFSLYFINSNKLFGKVGNKETKIINKAIFGCEKNIQLRDIFNINASQLKIGRELSKVNSNYRTKINDISLLNEETRTRIDYSIRRHILKIQNTKKKNQKEN